MGGGDISQQKLSLHTEHALKCCKMWLPDSLATIFAPPPLWSEPCPFPPPLSPPNGTSTCVRVSPCHHGEGKETLTQLNVACHQAACGRLAGTSRDASSGNQENKDTLA